MSDWQPLMIQTKPVQVKVTSGIRTIKPLNPSMVDPSMVDPGEQLPQQSHPSISESYTAVYQQVSHIVGTNNHSPSASLVIDPVENCDLSKSSTLPTAIDPDLIHHCQTILTELIGPIAPWLVQKMVQRIDQTINQTIDQTINQTIDQTTSQTIRQAIDPRACLDRSHGYLETKYSQAWCTEALIAALSAALADPYLTITFKERLNDFYFYSCNQSG